MAKDSCLTRVGVGCAVGGAIGGAIGAVYGTYEAVKFKGWFAPIYVGYLNSKHARMSTLCWWASRRLGKLGFQVPGLLKIRHVGQTTLGSAALFGLFLGAGSLIHCGKSY